MSAKYVFGIDLGLNNVGWAVIRKEKDLQVEAYGTYVFNSPLSEDNKATSGLKSRDRGMKRRSRRTLKRRSERKKALYRLLAENGFLPLSEEERVEMFCRHGTREVPLHPYALRAKALTEKLDPFHVGRVFCHLNQRRGFLSPRDLMLKGVGAQTDAKFDTEDEESGQTKKEIAQTRDAMGDFPTIGAFLAERMRNNDPVRKKTKKHKEDLSKDEIQRRFVRHDRAMLEKEFHTVWEAQSKHHPLLTAELKKQVEKLIFHQIPIGAQIGLRGKCTLFPKENRIAAASLTAQKFRIAQDLAHLKVAESPNSEERSLKPEERRKLLMRLMFDPSLIDEVVAEEQEGLKEKLRTGENLSWSEAKTLIGQPTTALFNLEPVPRKGRTSRGSTMKAKGAFEDSDQSGTKRELKGSKTVSHIKRVIGEKWDQLGPKGQENLVGILLTARSVPVYIRNENGNKQLNPDILKEKTATAHVYHLLHEKGVQTVGMKGAKPIYLKFTEIEAANLATLELPKGYLNLSLKAVKRVMPHLLLDKVYSEACKAVGLDHANPDATGEIFDFLEPKMSDGIKHPLVKCSVLSAIRVVNQLIKRYCPPPYDNPKEKPYTIRIELPRDLAKGAEERERIEKKNDESRRIRERNAKRIEEEANQNPADKDKIVVNDTNLKKIELWDECNTELPYEPGERIASIRDLLVGPYEIDHIVPRSYNFDNSRGNLVLCTSQFNKDKKDKCLFEVICSQDRELWPQIQAFIQTQRGQKNPAPVPSNLLPKQWRNIRTRVNSLKSMPEHKRKRILAEELPEKGFEGRHLTATGYISKEVLRIAKHLGVEVTVTQGSATGHLRRLWRLNDVVPLHPAEKNEKPKPGKPRSDYRHHAVDAVVIALTSPSETTKVLDFYRRKELGLPRTEDKPVLSPIPNLREQVERMIPGCPVVHRPDRRASGEFHKEQPVNLDVDDLETRLRLAQAKEKSAKETGADYKASKGEKVKGIQKELAIARGVIVAAKDCEPGKATPHAGGKYLIRLDEQGNVTQAYTTENKHHMVIWECLEKGSRGKFERQAKVVTMIEATRRRQKKEHVIKKDDCPQGWRFVMSICKGDTVEMTSGKIGVVSKLSESDTGVWGPHVAQQVGKINRDNDYLVLRMQNLSGLDNFKRRIVQNIFGETVFSEGPDD